AALSVLADEYAATDLQSIFLQLTLGYAGFGAHDDVGAHDAVLGKVDSGAQPGPVCTLRAGDLSAMLGYVTTRQGEKLAGWLDHDPKDRSDTDYQAFFLTQNLAMRKGLYKSLDKKDPGLAAMFAGEADRLIKRITSLENARLVRINRACLTIQRQLTGFLEAEKSQTGRLGYDDLISLTNRLLQGAGDWVRYKLDDTIHHILIDEAQDTNPQQWQIINQLCEPFFTGQDAHSEQRIRTLFVVGDAKQSIYRFQGARHHIFEESRRRYQHRSDAIGQPFTALPMEVSFRCAPAILAIVDQVAGRPDLAKALTIEHEPITHCAHHQGRRGLVVVWPLLVQNASGNPAGDPSGWVLPDPEMKAPSVSTHLARAIAAKIEAMIGHCWLDSRGRYAMAGDFMILLRNRKPFMAPLIRALHARNIRATGSDEATLIDEPAIIDLRSLLGFLALPANDLALAETLRSPFIGLGEEALMELAAHRPKDHTLWQALQSHKDPVFTSARKWLLHLLGLSDLIQPWQLIRRCLDLPCPGPGEGAEPASSGRKALACRLGNQCFAALEAFANLAEQYERSTPASLGGFLDFARQYGKQHKLNIARVDQNQVQIMTVHAAKGLQAPIIMLPEYQRKHGHAENVRMHAFELDGIDHHQARGDEVHMMRLLRPSEWDGDCLDALQKAEDQRDLEEEYRLLYVAMTRAEDQLHVMGCTRFSK
ncbi:MAG: UvrD-helicase domain-containing protein, partial [Pseudomonadota bacterium]